MIGGPGIGSRSVREPVGVALDTSGRIYVADRETGGSSNWSPMGPTSRNPEVPRRGFNALADIDAEGDVVFALDGERGLARLDPASGASTWLSPADGEGRITAGDGSGGIRWACLCRRRRRAQASWSSTTRGHSSSIAPVAAWSAGASDVADVEVDQAGTVWATDPANDSVVVFDASRAELGHLAPGDPDTLDGPAGIALRPAGSLFVANFDGPI